MSQQQQSGLDPISKFFKISKEKCKCIMSYITNLWTSKPFSSETMLLHIKSKYSGKERLFAFYFVGYVYGFHLERCFADKEQEELNN